MAFLVDGLWSVGISRVSLIRKYNDLIADWAVVYNSTVIDYLFVNDLVDSCGFMQSRNRIY